jgi:hypothetical protein
MSARGPGDQFFPDLGIAPDGTLNLAYYDDGYDSDGIKPGITLARSADGIHWAKTRVDTGLSDPRLESYFLSSQGQTTFTGDYLNMAVDGTGRAPTLPDRVLDSHPSVRKAGSISFSGRSPAIRYQSKLDA